MVQELEKIDKLIIASFKDKKIYLQEKGKIVRTINEVYFGKNGITDEKREGDMKTPLGLFNLGFAFGTKKLDTKYPYYEINDNVYWVSDSKHKYYNEWIELTRENKKFLYPYMHTCKINDWLEAEHLSDYKVQYEIALVIEYNINPKIKGAGSAIFLHVKNKDYTAGCVATTLENMKIILKWLEAYEGKILIK